jgi:pimeloyl-ACP methyl ester carboxylesterase
LIHGERDRRFPLSYALELKRSFAPGQVELYVGEGAGHSDSSRTPGFEAAIKSFLDNHLKQD